MAYTPELNPASSATLRRIAWALNQPMTRTINEIFQKLPEYIDRGKVCRFCRDPSGCNLCAFNDKDAA
jgi:recombinational DNA repair protein RecR